MTLVMNIVAPSSPMSMNKSNTAKIEKSAAKLGYKVKWGRHVRSKDRFLAGSDKERAQDLMSAFTDTKTQVIICTRGGDGSARLLDKLDWQKIKTHRKVFVGFSDTTVLQNALITKANMPSITGFIAGFWTRPMTSLMSKSLPKVLAGEGVCCEGLKCMAKGRAKGVLVGGCLSAFVGLLGTPYMPKLKGKILLLEEVGEEPYVVDRMLTHLKNAGVFDQVNGVILGEFYQCVPSERNRADGKVEVVLKEQFSNLKKPVVFGMPYSHGPSGMALPFGTNATIDANKGIVCIDGLVKKC